MAKRGMRKPKPPVRRREPAAGGHYLVVFTLAETDYVCNYILNGGNKTEFLEKFKGAYSEGFDPDIHLQGHRRGQPNHHAAR